MTIQPHAFTPSPGSARCAVPGCGSPRLAMIHAVRPPFFEGTLDSEADATPPFPQEPAFNSPAAVERAAETLRDDADMRDALEAMDEEADAEAPSELRALLEESQAEVEHLRAENASLRENLKNRRDGESYWKEAAGKALADLDRQHALAAENSRQRDALANALARTTISYPDNPAAGTHYAECSQGKRGQAPDDERCSNACKAVRAALKLSGRLKP